MCWTSRKEPIEKIAKKDIKVHKYTRVRFDFNKETDEIKSEYQRYAYRVGKTEYLNGVIAVQKDKCGTYFIDWAFHSYNPTKVRTETEITDRLYSTCVGVYTKALTDRLDFFWDGDMYRLVRMLCTIPKGSTYYENRYGEITSDTIRVDDVEFVVPHEI